eukprot:GEMP01061176.1.p1 GENE.GEMP01061176.1~~GEMP01061176.1.p1  ORF type:complete len:199 (+),score=30.82 GEMP01061176.1:101-697(+)
MGKARKTKNVGLKKLIKKNDSRTQVTAVKKPQDKAKATVREHVQANSSLFFQYNTNLKPPFRIILDTNFINLSIQNKCDPFKQMMELLLAKCIPCITDCVMAELEKLGSKYRLALTLAKDRRFERLACTHKGTYADDCLVERVDQHRCYIVGTNDRDLKRRIRRIPGVPIMFCKRGRYAIERLPDQIASVPLKTANKR